MFRNITLGQYYPGNSVLHRLDPRVKIFGAVVYVAVLFIINNIWGLIFPVSVLAAAIIISGIPLKYMLRGLRGIWVLLIFAVVFNIFSGAGNILWQWWIFRLSDKGILMAVFFSVRLICTVLGTGLLTYTTTPVTLTNGLEKIFSFLKVLHFPAHEIAMMMSIALRFIPILAMEADKIINAQLARGADFETGGVIKRLKGMTPVLIPLFVSAFKRASDLATAMEARCYNSGIERTKLHPLKYEAADKAAYIITAVFLIAAIFIRVMMDIYVVYGRI